MQSICSDAELFGVESDRSLFLEVTFDEMAKALENVACLRRSGEREVISAGEAPDPQQKKLQKGVGRHHGWVLPLEFLGKTPEQRSESLDFRAFDVLPNDLLRQQKPEAVAFRMIVNSLCQMRVRKTEKMAGAARLDEQGKIVVWRQDCHGGTDDEIIARR